MKKSVILFCSILLLAVGTASYAYDEIYEQAVKHFKRGEFKRAVPFLESYVVQKPDPGTYYMLGYAHYQLGNFDRSREYFEQAYLIDPEFSSHTMPAHAGISKEEQGLIHDALELSGAKRQMENYAYILSSSLPQFRSGMTDRKQHDEIFLLLRDSYRIDKIYDPVVRTFSSRINKEHLLAVIQWLKLPLGRKLTELEVAANRPEMLNAASAFRNEYDRLADRRKQRIREMEEALRATEMNTGLIADSLFGMLKGMQVSMQGSGKMDSDQIDELISNVRSVPKEQLTRDLLVALAFTYRSLTDEELNEVIRFYRSPEGRWFNDTSIEAISSAIGKASREIGEKMGSALLMKKVML